MSRYSLVLHLESAAIDTSLYPALAANNSARHESEAEAADLDRRTQRAWSSHSNVVMIRNRACGESFEKKKAMAVSAVLEHLGLASGSRVTKLFLLNKHVPTSVFDRERLRTDFFHIHSTFLRDENEAGSRHYTNRVVERRGRVGGVWAYSISRALHQGDGISEKFIEESRISGLAYKELLGDRAPSLATVHRKLRVFVCDHGGDGRDVAHRVIEVLPPSVGDESSDAAGTPKSRSRFSSRVSLGRQASRNASGRTTPTARDDNIEMLMVEVDEAHDGTYRPPAWVAPYIDHEIVTREEREKYTLHALASALYRDSRLSEEAEGEAGEG